MMNSRCSWNPAIHSSFSPMASSDARNLHDQEFGVEGVQDICRRCAGESPLDLLGHLFSTIRSSTANCKQWDDMTAAYFHFAG